MGSGEVVFDQTEDRRTLKCLTVVDEFNRWLFSSMTEIRVVINQWLEECNAISPHGSLDGINPAKFLKNWIEGNSIQQPETLTG